MAGCRIGMFCYGSGFASAFYSIKVCSESQDPKLIQICNNVSDMKSKLESRQCLDPAEFEQTLEMREKNAHMNDYSPSGSVEHFWDGTYYLQHVDSKYRRSYARKTKQEAMNINGSKNTLITNGHS